MTSFPTPDRHSEVTYFKATAEEINRDRVKQALAAAKRAQDSDETPECDMDVAVYLKTLSNGPRA